MGEGGDRVGERERQGGGKLTTGQGKVEIGVYVVEVVVVGGGEEEVGEDGDMKCQIQSKDYRDF